MSPLRGRPLGEERTTIVARRPHRNGGARFKRTGRQPLVAEREIHGDIAPLEEVATRRRWLLKSDIRANLGKEQCFVTHRVSRCHYDGE